MSCNPKIGEFDAKIPQKKGDITSSSMINAMNKEKKYIYWKKLAVSDPIS
jgi:hypothetical protein